MVWDNTFGLVRLEKCPTNPAFHRLVDTTSVLGKTAGFRLSGK
jgi:hypothetical protein